jgi:tRNA pseudouridine32 synthase/23S rRNA pseudouridine746 synthase
MGTWQLLHEDEALLVVDKPAGLLAVPGRGEAGQHNLAAQVQARFADALVVHRLDMATSGLMLFARGTAMQSVLNRAFAQRQMAKRYEAVVAGDVNGDSGSIEQALAADWPNRPRQVVDPTHGKPALTHWRVLQRGLPLPGQPSQPDGPGSATRLSLQPVTGRSHQLRVHLLWLGHPIVGDALYGPQPPLGARLLLHACELHFLHPASGQPCSFQSPAPF